MYLESDHVEANYFAIISDSACAYVHMYIYVHYNMHFTRNDFSVQSRSEFGTNLHGQTGGGREGEGPGWGEGRKKGWGEGGGGDSHGKNLIELTVKNEFHSNRVFASPPKCK
jgi:hypothetical protein